MRGALAAMLCCLGATALHAQGDDDLGDTGAPPPSAEDLGRVIEEPAAAPKEPAPPVGASPDAGPAPDVDPARPLRKRAPAPSAPRAPPSQDTLAKVATLKTGLDQALHAEPGDLRSLESLAGTWLPDGVVAGDAHLRALLKLARGRALLLQRRFDDAIDALTEARQAAETLPTQQQRPLVAQVKYRAAEVEELREGEVNRCGQALGLKRLAKLEGDEARRRVQDVAQRYQVAVKVGDRLWGRRAAFRIAALYEGYYRRGVEAKPGLRAVALPGPAAISQVDESTLVADLLHERWPAEIARLYGEIIASIDARAPDPALLEQVRARAAELGRLSAPAPALQKSPWFKDERDGLIRYARRYEVRTGELWLPTGAADAKPRLIEQLGRGVGTVDHAYALAALAAAGPAPGSEEIGKALASSEARVRVIGLYAAERYPDIALADTILAGYLALPDSERRAAFSSVPAAMWGEAARSLLAIRALAAKQRDFAEKLIADSRLPAYERAWLVAEIGDARLLHPLQSLANDRDASAAATAIYATYLAGGKNARASLRPTAEGLVGCVSRGVLRLDPAR